MTIQFKDAALYYAEEQHQVEAWDWLQYAVEADVIEEFAQRYRTPLPNTNSNPLNVPWQSQNDNLSGTGYRECFSSSMAMVAMYWGRVDNDDEYNSIRAKHGDTTSAEAQIATLRELGLNPTFVTNASKQFIINEVDAGRPCGVAWLHHGPVSHPSGGGHWTVATGYTLDSVIHNDPNGEADLIHGGYTDNMNGDHVKYSYKNWLPRWAVSNPNDGWAMQIKP